MQIATTTLYILTPTGEQTLNIEFNYSPGEPNDMTPGGSPGVAAEFTSIVSITEQSSRIEVDADGLFTLVNTNLRWRRLGDRKIHYFERGDKADKWIPYTLKSGEMLYPWNHDSKLPIHITGDSWQQMNIVGRVTRLEDAIETACNNRLDDMALDGSYED